MWLMWQNVSAIEKVITFLRHHPPGYSTLADVSENVSEDNDLRLYNW